MDAVMDLNALEWWSSQTSTSINLKPQLACLLYLTFFMLMEIFKAFLTENGLKINYDEREEINIWQTVKRTSD